MTIRRNVNRSDFDSAWKCRSPKPGHRSLGFSADNVEIIDAFLFFFYRRLAGGEFLQPVVKEGMIVRSANETPPKRARSMVSLTSSPVSALMMWMTAFSDPPGRYPHRDQVAIPGGLVIVDRIVRSLGRRDTSLDRQPAFPRPWRPSRI